jgi:hypothetical protein
MLGAAVFAGAAPEVAELTIAVGSDSAEPAPSAFVAVTRTRIV